MSDSLGEIHYTRRVVANTSPTTGGSENWNWWGFYSDRVNGGLGGSKKAFESSIRVIKKPKSFHSCRRKYTLEFNIYE